MVPDIAKAGHSFKGAMAYYLHDKGAQTAERVAWAETRNLATDDPKAAMRIMVATAQQADELKARAGVKNTGRKSTAHVYAYSLAWHPDEAGKIDRAEMVRAVDQSLKVLGADHLQAVIVCHQDQKHPHVHVILNRVDPNTGKMLSTSNDRLKLSDWANQYERERGAILTPKREEKRQLREQFGDRAQRREHATAQREKAAQRPTSAKSAGAMLKEFQEQQKTQHRAQWSDLHKANKEAREQIFAAYGGRIKRAAELHKAECKPAWREHFRQMRAERASFQRRERSLAGVVANSLAAATNRKLSEQLGTAGVLTMAFGYALSSQARAAAFADYENNGRLATSRRLKAILDTEISTLKQRRTDALAKQRHQFEEARGDLIEKQSAERSKIREAWRQHYERLPADRARKPYWKAPEKPAQEVREKPVKREFEKARDPRLEQRKAPTMSEYVARPTPAPSPAGDAPKPPARAVQQVPVPAPRPVPAQEPKPAVPAKDWSAATRATPAEQVTAKDWSKPAPATPSEPQPRKDWAERAHDRPREIKPLPVRDRSRDDGPER
jgi:hypothetical protein